MALSRVFFASALGLVLVGCGGDSESQPTDDVATGGTAGSESGGGGSGGTGGPTPEGGSAGVAGNAAGTGGTTDTGGTAGTGGYDFPDRVAEPTRCAPGDPGAELPAESFRCVVEDRIGEYHQRWDWDASTRTLTESGDRVDGTTWDLYWTYDVDGRAVRYGSTTDNMFYYESTYDEHGVVVRVTSNLYPDRLTEATYDDDGRLIREVTGEAAPDATLQSRAYGYDELGRLSTSDFDVTNDGMREYLTTTTYQRDCSLDLLEQQGSYHGWMDGVVVVRNRHFYDDAGRLIRRESDGGGFFDIPADGMTDEFDTWTYAADGSVATFERDGTADDVGGPADGTPDESFAFSPECTKLVGLSRELFRFPN